MAVSKRFTNAAVEFHTTVLGGVTDLTGNLGIEISNVPTDGLPYPRFQANVAENPTANVSTHSVAAWLGQAGVLGLNISTLTSGLHLFAQFHAAGGTRQGTLSHNEYVINDGLVVPRTLSVSGQGDAILNYEILAIYDGSNAQVIKTESQTLPASPTDAERFAIGPCTLANEPLSQVNSIEIDFGLDVQRLSADGEREPTFVSVVNVAPTITLRGTDPDWFKSDVVPLAGLDGTHANTSVFLRKRAAGGTWTADVTAQHVKFTMDGMVTIDQFLGASGQDPGEVVVVMRGSYDGTNNPLVVDTTSAI